MSENVKQLLESNASLPKGSKKRSRSTKRLKKKGQATTPAQPSKNVSRETIPATVIPAPFDIEEAQNIVFKPNAGPQTDFLASGEREVLYGGAAGGGKSYATLADPLRNLNHHAFRTRWS